MNPDRAPAPRTRAIALRSPSGLVHAARLGSTAAVCGVADLRKRPVRARTYHGIGYHRLTERFDEITDQTKCQSCLSGLAEGWGRVD